MSTTAEIRLGNLKTLIEEFGTQEDVAERAGTSQVYLSQLRNKSLDSKTGRPREIGARLARKLESGCNKPIGWMDVVHGVDEQTHRIAEPAVVYEIAKQAPDPMTVELINLFCKLDRDGKSQCLNYVRGFVEGRSPHAYGQALPLAGQKTGAV